MLGFKDDRDYGSAARVLQTAGFTEKAVSAVIEREAIITMPTGDVPRIMRRTSDLSPLDTLIRLFFLGVPVHAEAVQRAFAPMPLASWVEAELLANPDIAGQVDPRVQIWPINGLMLAVDLPWRRATAPDADFVVPPGPLTLQLANVMIRRPSERVLDLGTGSGALAMLASPFAGLVTATDTNRRALAFAQFNSRLNQIENVRCLAGDLFEPVAQERFELILCNPPFVISPTKRFLYRDSGERGDVFCRRLARAAVNHLEIGGFFQFTANIAHQYGRSWKDDLESWFENLDCDALVLVERTEKASDYAMNWILSTETKEPALVSQRYETWMDYFHREQIEAVSYLFLTLRRSVGGAGWIQIDDPPCQIVGPCGDEIERFFQCRDRFGNAADMEAMLDCRFRMAPEILLEQECAMGSRGLEVRHIRVRKTGGLQYPMTIHNNVAQLLAGCSGARTLRQLLEELFGMLNADWDKTLPVVLPAVQSLMERGVLVQVD
ncbi:MAG: methyltransferase [Syntrophobacteraceae bacterium]